VGTPTYAVGDVGTLYVLLINQENQVVAEAATSDAEGYAYLIPNLAPGSYTVVAGTDPDDDDRINNAGEAFGAYGDLVQLGQNMYGVDFAAGF